MHSDGLGVPGHTLHPLDREALQAVYLVNIGSPRVSTLAEEYGWWSEETIHYVGDLGGGAAFGVAARPGGAQAWAYGPTPWTNLADNPKLSGSASWSGSIFGLMTTNTDLFGGNADLGVDLSTLTGRLDFTELAVGDPLQDEEPRTWGDGDLGYTIAVRGNTFVQTGGDVGAVTGAFFGPSHEAMGGNLKRTDLTAAFGGTR